MFLRTRGQIFELQATFGLTGTPLGLWLRFGKRLLIAILTGMDGVKVGIPCTEQLFVLSAIIEERYPSLKDFFLVCDGLKLPIEKPDDSIQQSMFYNGWTHGHYVTNLFGFTVDGMIMIAVINAAGSMHDSTLAEWGNVYTKLEEVYNETGLKAIMDSAFCLGNREYVFKSAQNYNIASR